MSSFTQGYQIISFLNTIHEQLVDEIIVIRDPPLLINPCLGDPSVRNRRFMEDHDNWKFIVNSFINQINSLGKMRDQDIEKR